MGIATGPFEMLVSWMGALLMLPFCELMVRKFSALRFSMLQPTTSMNSLSLSTPPSRES